MKKIYLLPNLFTLCNLLCGYWSITFSFKNNFATASILIYLSLVFDTLDGRIARLTKTTSRFGLEFDSIADVISFGIAPACIIYSLFSANQATEKLAWWGCFIYVVCGALRLARYNVQSCNEEKHDFTGLPIPCAAGMIAAYVLFMTKYGLTITPKVIIFMVIPLGLLMVSTIRYTSFQTDVTKRKPFDYLVFAVIFLGLLVRFPHYILLITSSGYIIFGLLFAIKEKMFKKSEEEIIEEV